MKPASVLIIDDDDLARTRLRQALQQAGLGDVCQVCGAEDLKDRAEDKALAVFWLSGDPSPEHPVIRDNNIFTKPVRLGALLDHVRRTLDMQDQQKREKPTKIGPYDLYPGRSLLQRHGEDVRLTDKETHILELLAAAGAAGVDRRGLLEQVWGYAESVETHTLETHIYRLRQKIEDDPAAPEVLLTTEGHGYRLKT